MKIFLTGFMGCGKTTLAKKLSGRLNFHLVDLDHEIEKQVGTSIGDYFSVQGETAFRTLESQVLKAFPYQENSIIATGGGTPCYFDNMDWMNQNGLTVYIEMTPAALARRLENGKAKRPLLRDLDEQGIVDFITQKLEERNPYYTQASLVVNGINLSPESLEALIFNS